MYGFPPALRLVEKDFIQDDSQGLHAYGAAEGREHVGFAFAHAIIGQQGFVIHKGIIKPIQLQLFVNATLERRKAGIIPEIILAIHIYL